MKKMSFKSLYCLTLCTTVYAMLSCAFADGLPGEYLLSTRWRDLMWWHSPLSNPAFLTAEDQITIRGAFSPTMQGAFSLWETGVTVPFGAMPFGISHFDQAAGFSLIGESDGSIVGSALDNANGRLVAGTSPISNNNIFGMFSYAIKPWRKLSCGLNMNVAYQSNFGSPRKGIGFDIGCSYEIAKSQQAGDHLIGLSTVNLIAPSMGTSFFSRSADGGDYARALRLSWAGTFFNRQLESGLDLDLRDFFAKLDEFKTSWDSTNVSKSLEWGLSWRVGGWMMNMLCAYAQAGCDEHGLEYWGLAGGARIPLADKEQHISVLYQYNIKTEGAWASSHTIYFLMNFGKNRRDVQQAAVRQQPAVATPRQDKGELEALRRIQGLKIEDDNESVRITAEEVAIHFGSGSAQMPPEALRILAEITAFLRSYPNHLISIEGHTDNDPISGKLQALYKDNLTLSKTRAEQVKDFFVVQQKLPAGLFTTTGYGDTKPLVPNDNPENKYKNRRVVIVIKK